MKKLFVYFLTAMLSLMLPVCVHAAKEYSVTVEAGEGGRIKLDGGSPGTSQTGTFTSGIEVPIEAIANEGYVFIRWDGDAVKSTAASSTVTYVGRDKNIKAIFAAREYVLTTRVNSSTLYGEITTTTTVTVTRGGSFSIKAQAYSGYKFDGWTLISGDAVIVSSGSATTDVRNVLANTIVEARFVASDETKYFLTLEADTGGTASYVGTNPFNEYTYVSIKAVPNAGYEFVAWEGGAEQPNKAETEVVMTSSRTLKAKFAEIKKNFSIKAQGNGHVETIGLPGLSTASGYSSSADVVAGTKIKVSAQAADGFRFKEWQISQGEAGSIWTSVSANPDKTQAQVIEVTMPNHPLTLTAVFEKMGSMYTLAIAVKDTGGNDLSGSIAYATASGSFVHPATSDNTTVELDSRGSNKSGSYLSGTVVSISLNRVDELYEFVGWEGDLSGTSLSPTVTLNNNKSVTARFSKTKSSLTIDVNSKNGDGTPQGGNIVKNVSSGVNFGPAFPDIKVYTTGSTQKIKAVAASGWIFYQWSGSALSSATETGTKHADAASTWGSDEVTVTLNKNETLTASFIRAYSLNINVSPSGAGSTTGQGVHASPGSPKVVNINATPSGSYVFTGWTGDVDSIGNANLAGTTITMNKDRTLTANFALGRKLTVIADPSSAGIAEATGLINGVSTKIKSNDSPNYKTYADGTSITLATSSIQTGYELDHWENGSGATITSPITLTADTTVKAVFKKKAYNVNVTVSPAEAATALCSVSKSPSKASYEYGDNVQLTATAASGWLFAGWSSPVPVASRTASSYTFENISSDIAVTANFVKAHTLTTKVVHLPTEYGSSVVVSNYHQRTSGDGKGDTVYTCAGGANITFSAQPKAGYVLDHWELDGVDKGTTLSINPMDANHTVVAYFKRSWTLNLTVSDTSAGKITLPKNATPSVTTHKHGETVTIKAESLDPTVYKFVRWQWVSGGSPTGSYNQNNAETSLSMEYDYGIKAVFEKVAVTLETEIYPGGANPALGAWVSRNNWGPYKYGDSVQLTANESCKDIWYFSHWVDLGSDHESDADDVNLGSQNPITVVLNGSKKIRGVYRLTSELNTQVITEPALVSTPDIMLRSAARKVIAAGSTYAIHTTDDADLSAPAISSYALAGWSTDGSNTVTPGLEAETVGNDITIAMSSDRVVKAIYVKDGYGLTINVNPAGTGTYTKSPNKSSYAYNDTVDISANANTGYQFKNWTGQVGNVADVDSASTSITLDDSYTITANFEPIDVQLTVVIDPTNKGSVADTSRSLTFSGSSTTHTYKYNDEITLTPTATPGYLFSHFSINGNKVSDTFTITGNTTVTAHFKEERTLNVKVYALPDGANIGGSVSIDGAKSNPSSNIYKFLSGDYVDARAIPAAGYVFLGWNMLGGTSVDTGDVNNASNPYPAFQITTDRAITAIFAKRVSLTTSVNDPDGGYIRLPSDSLSTTYHKYGDTPTIEAVAKTGYEFSGWTGDIANVLNVNLAATSITMEGDYSIVANFTKKKVSLTVQIDPALGGTISDTTNSKNFSGASSVQIYDYNDTVTLVPSAGSDYIFSHWTDAGGSPTTGNFNITENTTITAHFKLKRTLTVIVTTIPSGTGGTYSIGSGYYSNPSTNVYTYKDGDVASLTANPDSGNGYVFKGWYNASNVLLEDSLAVSVSMDDDMTLIVVFAKDGYILTTQVNDNAMGYVTVAPVGPYAYGDEPAIKAIAKETGYQFVNWTAISTPSATFNAAATNAENSVTMHDNYTVQANFEPKDYNLTINVKLGDNLTSDISKFPINVNGDNVNPGSSATVKYKSDAVLTAPIGDSDWIFVKWEGVNAADINKRDGAKVRILGDQTVTAIYKTRFSYEMAMVGSGTISPAPGVYYTGQDEFVTIEATENDSGYSFSHWEVDGGSAVVSPTDKKTTVKIDVNGKKITAVFKKKVTFKVEVDFAGTRISGSTSALASSTAGSAGVIETTNAYIRAQMACLEGDTVRFKTVPSGSYPGTNYEFVGWDMNNDGTVDASPTGVGPHSITMPNSDLTVVAVYQRREVILTVLSEPADESWGRGFADTGLGGTFVTAKTTKFYAGETAYVDIEEKGYTFDGWYWNNGTYTVANRASTAKQYSFTITQNTTITAKFSIPPDMVELWLFIHPEGDPSTSADDYGVVSAATGGSYGTFVGERLIDGSRRAFVYLQPKNMIVPIYASATKPGWGFSHWNGDDDGDRANIGEPDKSTTYVNMTKSSPYDYPVKVTAYLGTEPIIPIELMAFVDGVRATSMWGWDRSYNPSSNDHWIVKGSQTAFGGIGDPYLYLHDSVTYDWTSYAPGVVETFSGNCLETDANKRRYAFEKWVVRVDVDKNGSYSSVQEYTSAGDISVTVNYPTRVEYYLVTQYVTVRVDKETTGPVSAANTAVGTVVSPGEDITPVGAEYQLIKYPRGAKAPQLRATIDSTNYDFEGWAFDGGAIGYTGLTLNQTQISQWMYLYADRTATAKFIRLHDLTVGVDPAAFGKAEVNLVYPEVGLKADKNKPEDTRKYRHGRSFTVVATPEAHKVLLGWEIKYDTDHDGSFDGVPTFVADGGSKTYTVNLTQKTSVTAKFATEKITLKMAVAPVGAGNVSLEKRADYTEGSALPGTLTPVSLPDAGTQFFYADEPSVKAEANTGYLFNGWTVVADDASSVANANPSDQEDATVFIDKSKTLTANFVQSKKLTVVVTPAAADIGGVTNPETGVHYIKIGETVQVSVNSTPTGYEFAGWTIDYETENVKDRTEPKTTSAVSVEMSDNVTVTAIFKKLYTLTLDVSPADAKTEGCNLLDANGRVSAQYADGDIATITAKAVTGYEFDSWDTSATGAVLTTVSSTATEVRVTLPMDKDHTVVAKFKKINYDLKVVPSIAGAANQLKEVNPGTHDFLTVDTKAYPYKTDVTLEAVANTPNYRFVRWIDADTNATLSSNAQYVHKVVKNQNIKAVFIERYTLEMEVSPVAAGTISPSVAGSPYYYDNGSIVAVSVSSTATGYQFSHWSSPDSPTSVPSGKENASGPFNITIDKNKKLVANFAKLYTLTLKTDPLDGSMGTVSATGGTSSIGNTRIYVDGTTATITAAPAPVGYEFDSWSISPSGTLTEKTPGNLLVVDLTMDKDYAVTAKFKKKNFEITVSTDTPSAASELKVTAAGYAVWDVKADPTSKNYAYQTSLNLIATAASGYRFDKWVDAVTGITVSNPHSVTANKHIKAVFVQQFELDMTVSPVGAGTVSPSVESSPHTYDKDTMVPVKWVSNASNYKFKNWTGDVPAGSENAKGPFNVKMDGNKSLTANFDRLYSLTLSTDPSNGWGTVSATGVDSETGKYIQGTKATITAAPAAIGYEFDSWEVTPGATLTQVGTDPKVVELVMNNDYSVVAKFKKKLFTLKVTTEGGASALTKSNAPTHDFLANNTVELEYQTNVILSATAASGYRFVKWTDASGVTTLSTSSTYSLGQLTANREIKAIFIKTFTLTLTANPSSGGAASASPNQTEYDSGSVVNVTQTFYAGYRFMNWTGDVPSGFANSSSGFSVTMDSNKSITANYVQRHTLTVNSNNASWGTVSADATVFDHNGMATITANPGTNYELDSWTVSNGGVVIGSGNTVTLTMDQAYTVTANFKPKNYTLTVLSAQAGAAATIEGLCGIETHNFKATSSKAYPYGETVTLSASAASGYRFIGFSDDPAGAQMRANSQITISGSQTVYAQFVQRVTLKTHISVDGNNKDLVSPPPGFVKVEGASVDYTMETAFDKGDVAMISANAGTGHNFNKWVGSGIANVNADSTSVIMNSSKEVTADFSRKQYTLSVVASPLSIATFSGAGTYFYGDQPVITIDNSNEGYAFQGWDTDEDGVIDDTNTSPDVTITKDLVVTAHFKKIYRLIVSANPDDKGMAIATTDNTYLVERAKTSSSPNVYEFTESEGVGYVKAMPVAGYRLMYWTGPVNNPYALETTVPINGIVEVTAYFEPAGPNRTLSIAVAPADAITAGCTVTGAGTYSDGTIVDIEATSPDENLWIFDSWSGDAVGSPTASSWIDVAGSNKSITANFKKRTFSVSVNASPSNGGVVSGGGNYEYNASIPVSLISTDPNYVFEGWSILEIEDDGTYLPVVTRPASDTSFNHTVTKTAIITAIFKGNTTKGQVSVVFTDPAAGTITHLDSSATELPNHKLVGYGLNSGYRFSHLSGDTGLVSKTDHDARNIFVDETGVPEGEVKVVYIETNRPSVSVVTQCLPAEGGRINVTSGPYYLDQRVSFSVRANPGWKFVGYESNMFDGRDTSTSMSIVLTKSLLSVKAIFEKAGNKYQVTVNPAANSTMSVQGETSSSSFVTVCDEGYVDVSSNPNVGFSHETLIGSGGVEVVDPSAGGGIMVKGNGAIGNKILKENVLLRVIVAEPDVVDNIYGYVQGGDHYKQGDEVLIKATSKSPYIFSGWRVISGDATITGSKVTIGMQDSVVMAVFVLGGTGERVIIEDSNVTYDTPGEDGERGPGHFTTGRPTPKPTPKSTP